MIQERILELVEYGLVTGLLTEEDKIFTTNALLELFQVDDIEDCVFEDYATREPMTQETAEAVLEDILEDMIALVSCFDYGLIFAKPTLSFIILFYIVVFIFLCGYCFFPNVGSIFSCADTTNVTAQQTITHTKKLKYPKLSCM